MSVKPTVRRVIAAMLDRVDRITAATRRRAGINPPSTGRAARVRRRRGRNPFSRIPSEITDIEIGTVIDVGAAHGTPRLYRTFPDAYLLLVDPLTEHEHALASTVAERPGSYAICAVGAAAGVADIAIAPDHLTRTSFLERTELTDFAAETIETRPVTIRRLDDVVDEHAVPTPYGLKIDTEGFELEVLHGSTETLAGCVWVIAEVSIARRFEGSYEFVELIRFMDDQGFTVANILHVSRKDDIAKYADVLFVRRDRPG